jgi:hypothetical protein
LVLQLSRRHAAQLASSENVCWNSESDRPLAIECPVATTPTAAQRGCYTTFSGTWDNGISLDRITYLTQRLLVVTVGAFSLLWPLLQVKMVKAFCAKHILPDPPQSLDSEIEKETNDEVQWYYPRKPFVGRKEELERRVLLRKGT